MATIEERVGALIEKHLGIEDRTLLDAPMSKLGINSMDAVAFLRAVGQEFGGSIAPDVAAGFTSMRDLISYLETRAG